MKKRSHRLEKMARIYDDEILPIWSHRFGRMLLRDLVLPPKAIILDVGCGTGYPCLELIKKIDERSRIIAIEAVPPLLDVARKKAGSLSGKKIFFRSEPASPHLAFADDVYDLVISNLGLLERGNPEQAMAEFARVTKPQGRITATLPLSGTYGEFYDIYQEILAKNNRNDLLEELKVHMRTIPDPATAIGWMEKAGLEQIDLEVDEFTLLFQTSREFFFAPVIEYGPLFTWKEIAGKGSEMQQIFWQIKEAIDCYFKGRAFELTIKAGCLRAIKSKTKIVLGEDSQEETRPRAEIPENFELDEEPETPTPN